MANLEWYRSFVEVHRCGTVSGAAIVLHLTQPAVSQHVAALEATLGVALFQRMPRRMLPTEAGQRLYTRVVEAIETLESVPGKANWVDETLIRLGSPPEFFNEVLLGRLPIDRPLLSVQFGVVQELIDRLVANELDGAIATQKISQVQLDYCPIFEEQFWLVGPPGIEVPIEGWDTETGPDLVALEAWLRPQYWIAYGEELPIIRRFWRSVFGRRLEVRPGLILPDLRSIRSAIGLGLGYSVLPDYLCRDWIAEGRLTLVLQGGLGGALRGERGGSSQADRVTNQLWLAYRKSERQSQQVQVLLSWLDGIQSRGN
jgi:DNA-binding transcriptional LysR family regulator